MAGHPATSTALPGLQPTLVFDFDSTLVSVEGLDVLFARAVATSDPALLEPFEALTNAGMEGAQPQEETLRARLALFPPGGPSPDLIQRVGEEIVDSLSRSVARHITFFRDQAHRIHIVSGGFRELILPTARHLGLPDAHVTAHAFRHTPQGLQLDPATPMAQGGKTVAIQRLLESGVIARTTPLWMIGDGATDLEVRTSGFAQHFVAYTEHVYRPAVVAAADAMVGSIEALLALLPQANPGHGSPS